MAATTNFTTVTLHLHRQIALLKQQANLLGTLVEEQFENALRALAENDLEPAEKVVQLDKEVDQREITLEEECLKIIALYQPVAVDMRFLISTIKITNDLERIGDLARDIAQLVISNNGESRERIIDFAALTAKVKWMVRKGLEAMIALDSQMARDVCNSDDEVDEQFRLIKEKVISELGKGNSNVRALITELTISDYMESIADHAKKICEDVVYTVDAEVIRHSSLVDTPKNLST
jgi:phosphate transport system protein